MKMGQKDFLPHFLYYKCRLTSQSKLPNFHFNGFLNA